MKNVENIAVVGYKKCFGQHGQTHEMAAIGIAKAFAISPGDKADKATKKETERGQEQQEGGQDRRQAGNEEGNKKVNPKGNEEGRQEGQEGRQGLGKGDKAAYKQQGGHT